MSRMMILVLGFLLTQPLLAEERNAQTDSKLISGYMEANYTHMVEQFVEVFLGHINCQYDFIDEQIFNDLADNAIKDLTRKAAEVISTNPQHEWGADQQPLIDYVASVLALSVMDVHSSAESTQIRARIEDGTITCDNSREKHNAIYEKLVHAN